MWRWHSGPQAPDLDVCWRAYLRRFDMEHAFKLMKSQLGWTAARVRHPGQAVRWTWLPVAAYVQLRLARGMAAGLRRPWERRARPGRPLTPYRVRRSFRHLRDRLGTPARLPKTTRPGPGRPPGGKNTPAPRHRLGSELRKPDTSKKYLSNRGSSSGAGSQVVMAPALAVSHGPLLQAELERRCGPGRAWRGSHRTEAGVVADWAGKP
jgi:hypothetical protein